MVPTLSSSFNFIRKGILFIAQDVCILLLLKRNCSHRTIGILGHCIDSFTRQ
jgi:hypothetical protein